MTRNSKWKITGISLLVILLLAGLLAIYFYHNRQNFYPKIDEVTYLQAQLGKDTTAIQAGIRVVNHAPFSFRLDSIRYQIRHQGVLLGNGKQVAGQTLPALKSTLFNGRLFLYPNRYKQLLAQNQNQDSLKMEVKLQVYFDPPFLKQQHATITRTFATAISKAPAFKIDTFFVKSFSPDSGYTFQLNLNTSKASLPDLQLHDFNYTVRLADSLQLNGRIDSPIKITPDASVIPLFIHLKTAEMVDLLRLKLSNTNTFPYTLQASAIIKTGHPLFENTAIAVRKNGMLDLKKVGSGPEVLPVVKRIKKLDLAPKGNTTYLRAEVLLYNPSKLPLYLDSARFLVQHRGKTIARGGGNFKKILPAKKVQSLRLQLAVNTQNYQQALSGKPPGQEIPLDIDLLLPYNLKDSKPRQIRIREKINIKATEAPTVEFSDLGIRQLDPEKGAQLLVKLKVHNRSATRSQIEALHYSLQLKKDIGISGQTDHTISLDSGTTEVEIPVNLSAQNVNQIVKNLIRGEENWEYFFQGKATVSVPGSIWQQTEISLQTKGVYSINSKGSPDYMPEISKIDTLNIAIHYDTAWVHLYAAIYNTLPATIHIAKLQVDVLHDGDTIGKSEEKLDLNLAPDTNSFAWHTLGLNYGLWEKHVLRQQKEDSMFLNLPVSLIFNLGNLGEQPVQLDLSTSIPTPGTPATELQRMKLRGFSFREGLKFDALVAVQNANSKGLTLKNIAYRIVLDNGVVFCGNLNRSYKIPVGLSEVKVPVNLGIWPAIKMLKRQLLGPPQIDYKLNATAQVNTANPKLNDVFVIFENWSQGDLKAAKKLKVR